ADLGAALVAGSAVPIHNRIGRTSLFELAALIARARLVVSNDTASAHLGAAVGTPVVCVLGGGHFGRFFPYPDAFRAPGALPLPVWQPMDCYGCDWDCIYPVARGMPRPCIEGVSIDAVWKAIERRIGALDQESGRQALTAEFV